MIVIAEWIPSWTFTKDSALAFAAVMDIPTNPYVDYGVCVCVCVVDWVGRVQASHRVQESTILS